LFWLCVVLWVGAAFERIIIRAGANMILMKEKVFFLARRVSFPGRSSLCLGARESRRESTNVRKGSKFFVFWLPRFNTFSPKFLDKKKLLTQKERRRPTKWRERERERDFVDFVSWCFLSWGRMFLSFLFRGALFVF
jgi:hypothetical protein